MESKEAQATLEEVPPTEVQVPREPTYITSMDQLVQEMDQLQVVLKDLNEEWTVRLRALQHFQQLVQTGHATEFEQFLPLFEEKLLNGFLCQLEDRRSTLSREASNTVSVLAKAVKADFEPLAVKIVPTLFRVLIITIKVIADGAHECILSFLDYAATCAPLFVEGTSNPHPVVRSRCSEYIAAILTKHSADSLRPFVDSLSESIKKSLRDSAPASRTAAKKAFQAFRSHFAEQGDALLSTLDATLQKQLAATEKKPERPSARPNFRQMIKQKVEKPSVEIVVAAAPEPVVVAPAVEPPKEVKEPETEVVAKIEPVVVPPAKPEVLEKPVEVAPEPEAGDEEVSSMETEAEPEPAQPVSRKAKALSSRKRVIEDKTNVPVSVESPKRTKKDNKKTVIADDKENSSASENPKKPSDKKKTADTKTDAPEKKIRAKKYSHLLDFEKGNTPVALKTRSRTKPVKSGKALRF